jgi:hypothetical protein
MFLGLLLTWQARIHLGRLWSSAITRKERHRVVDTGPYAFVRHPIYTGIITAVLATAVAEATFTALAGAAFICSGLYLKARAEERFLMVELDYESYYRFCGLLSELYLIRGWLTELQSPKPGSSCPNLILDAIPYVKNGRIRHRGKRLPF